MAGHVLLLLASMAVGALTLLSLALSFSRGLFTLAFFGPITVLLGISCQAMVRAAVGGLRGGAAKRRGFEVVGRSPPAMPGADAPVRAQHPEA
jgi:hypothetical protein